MYLPPFPSLPTLGGGGLFTALVSILHLPFLIPSPEQLANTGTACTFSIGPPVPDTGLCSAFHGFCEKAAKEILASRPPAHHLGGAASAGASRDWSSGCVGGHGRATDGRFISGYTVSCVVGGIERVPTVFPDFLDHELTFQGEDGVETIPYSFVGCQVPPRG